MALSAFADKSRQPREDDLEKVMGITVKHWKVIIKQAAGDYPPLEESWGFSGTAWGWALRLRQKKRTIMYLTPCKGYFIAGFALGEKAVRAAKQAGLDESTVALIDGAPKYAEGRAVRIEVRRKRDREQVIRLVAIKMEN
ncbi:DUF3788 domain-containing protein [Candidatus Eisenbacteria bacterium]|uniref:DUF3788 domain-containing protein n=1 Tax=Eiseniibacteriota bacterium TaxID=2212470 RepID=A0ABV6YPP5_UNCEI